MSMISEAQRVELLKLATDIHEERKTENNDYNLTSLEALVVAAFDLGYETAASTKELSE